MTRDGASPRTSPMEGQNLAACLGVRKRPRTCTMAGRSPTACHGEVKSATILDGGATSACTHLWVSKVPPHAQLWGKHGRHALLWAKYAYLPFDAAKSARMPTHGATSASIPDGEAKPACMPGGGSKWAHVPGGRATCAGMTCARQCPPTCHVVGQHLPAWRIAGKISVRRICGGAKGC